MKQKVAIIDPLGAHGSSHHFYLFGQTEGLRNHGVNVSLYTNNKTNNPNIRGVKFYQFFVNIFSREHKVIRGLRYLTGSLLSIFHARFSGVSIFHFHVFNTNMMMLFNLILVKLLLGKVVHTIHDVTSFANNGDSSLASKIIYSFTDLILTHNQFSKEEIVKIYSSLNNKIHIVPHGNYIPFINIQKDKEASRKILNLPQGKKVLLFFGIIKKEKGLEVLLNAMTKLSQQHDDIVLLIAGKIWKNNFSMYQKIIDENNLSKKVILHTRFIPYEDVEHYYCASDLVVLPYKKIYQSGVLMMSLSYERPVLVSDLPSLREIITDDENGFLVQTDSSEALARRLSGVLSDHKNLERVRVNGNELIKRKFSWYQIGQLTKKAYKEL